MRVAAENVAAMRVAAASLSKFFIFNSMIMDKYTAHAGKKGIVYADYVRMYN